MLAFLALIIEQKLGDGTPCLYLSLTFHLGILRADGALSCFNINIDNFSPGWGEVKFLADKLSAYDFHLCPAVRAVPLVIGQGDDYIFRWNPFECVRLFPFGFAGVFPDDSRLRFFFRGCLLFRFIEQA